jgi:hypothetical protein
MAERDDQVRGYEFTKGQYVQLTEAELASLETESSNHRTERVYPTLKDRPCILRGFVLPRRLAALSPFSRSQRASVV